MIPATLPSHSALTAYRSTSARTQLVTASLASILRNSRISGSIHLLRRAVADRKNRRHANGNQRHLHHERMPAGHREMFSAAKAKLWRDTECAVLLALQAAARKARTNRPITSSMTAAPRITDASGEVILPASISVRAEMETLVAVSAPPRNHAAVPANPKRWAAPAPRKNGQITPSSATRNAVGPGLAHALDVGLKTGDKHQHQAADLRQQQKASPAGVPLNRRMCSNVQAAGTGHHADHQFAENRGNSKARLREATIFPAGSRMAISSANCRSAGIVSYPDRRAQAWIAIWIWTCGGMGVRRASRPL